MTLLHSLIALSHERPAQRLLRNRVGLPVGRLETTRIALPGQVTEQRILYSALDAYVRHFNVVVPPDAVAHIDPELGDAALMTALAEIPH